MSRADPQMTPRLVLTNPGPLRGTVFDLTEERQVVGRAGSSQLRVDDPGVSLTHAVVCRAGDRTTVEDLASTNGTLVNGQRIRGPQVLRSGDVLAFGRVVAQYEECGNTGTSAPSPNEARTAETARFDLGNQAAVGNINNIGRDQYNEYIHQVVAQRESFLREIAATRTRARRLIWVGFVLFLAGGGVYTWVIIKYVAQVNNLSQTDQTQNLPRLFGPELHGVPIGLIGFVVAMIGAVLIVVGIVLHIVATSRRRRLDTQAPLQPPPPPFPPQYG